MRQFIIVFTVPAHVATVQSCLVNCVHRIQFYRLFSLDVMAAMLLDQNPLDRIQSAEILYDYHNVPLKNAPSMMTAARNYIQCFSTMFFRHVTKFCENLAHPPKERRKLSQSDYYSIICCMFSANCHTIGGGRLTVCHR